MKKPQILFWGFFDSLGISGLVHELYLCPFAVRFSRSKAKDALSDCAIEDTAIHVTTFERFAAVLFPHWLERHKVSFG